MRRRSQYSSFEDFERDELWSVDLIHGALTDIDDAERRSKDDDDDDDIPELDFG